MQWVRRCYRRAEIANMMRLFELVTPFERTRFVSQTNESIAVKYRRQIQHMGLDMHVVILLARCAVAYAVDYISVHRFRGGSVAQCPA